MSVVLFDEPGPRTRRRVAVASAIATVLVLALVVAGVLRLAGRGMFDADRWDIFYESTEVWQALWRGLRATLRAAAVAALIAVFAGSLVAIARSARTPWLRAPAALFVELFRGLPVLLMMLFAFFGFGLSTFFAVVTGLALYNTAVIAEILRAGLLSLPAGQREAALSVGLREGQALRLVLLPQAVRLMLPSLVSQLVVLLKDTSLGFVVGYIELLRTTRELRDFFGNRYIFSIVVVAAAIYIGVNFLLSSLASYLQRRGRSSPVEVGPQVAPEQVI